MQDCCLFLFGNENYIEEKSVNKQEIKDKKEMNITFFYDQSTEKIDKNIHRIIFYEEYKKGYYNEYLIDIEKKDIILLYNKDIRDITSIINYIYKNGIMLKNQKWQPKEVWIFD